MCTGDRFVSRICALELARGAAGHPSAAGPRVFHSGPAGILVIGVLYLAAARRRAMTSTVNRQERTHGTWPTPSASS
jgi:hypothetical protein